MFLKTDGAGNLSFSSDLPTTSFTGATVETSIADSDLVLIYDDSATAVRKMTKANFTSGIGGNNTPAFYVYRTANQTLTNGVSTKIQFTSEDFDTDSAFDSTTNYRFTVPNGKDGKYFFHCCVLPKSAGSFDLYFAELALKKNGTNYKLTQFYDNQSYRSMYTPVELEIIISLVAGDYIEMFCSIEGYSNTGSPVLIESDKQCSFMGYKLI